MVVVSQHGFWEPNPGPLEKQPELLTTPYLSSLHTMALTAQIRYRHLRLVHCSGPGLFSAFYSFTPSLAAAASSSVTSPSQETKRKKDLTMQKTSQKPPPHLVPFTPFCYPELVHITINERPSQCSVSRTSLGDFTNEDSGGS